MSRPVFVAALLVVTVLGLAQGCIDMPGDRGEDCSENGFCAAGLVCNVATGKCGDAPAARDCVEGDTRPCGSKEGACQKGVETCEPGGWGLCGGPDLVEPQAEISCDGIDNNCDGNTDEGSCPGWASTCNTSVQLCASADATSCAFAAFGPDQGERARFCAVPAGNYPFSLSSPTLLHVDAFFIDRYEVSNARYQAYFDSLSVSDKDAARPDCNNDFRDWSVAPSYFDSELADHPVLCVTRAQAQDFCLWAGKRLPEEAEWEVAASGAAGLAYPWGASFETQRANCNDSACHDVYGEGICGNGVGGGPCPDTAPVNTLAGGASPFGVLHMAGNVSEWVDGAANEGFVRGGSYADFEAELRTDARDLRDATSNVAIVGFRCAMSVPGT